MDNTKLGILKYKNYAKKVTWFLIISGLWPDTHPILKKFLVFLSFTSSLAMIIAVSNFCFHNITDVRVVTKGLGLTVSFLSVFLKVVLFSLYQGDLISLNEILAKSYMRDLENKDDQPCLIERIPVFNFFLYGHGLSLATAMSVYAFNPLHALRKYGTYIRAFPVIYPFSYEPGGVVHWILYGIEFFGAMSLWTVSIGVDCSFGLYSLQMCGELRVLAKRFHNMRSSSDYKTIFKECIQRHYIILQSKRILEHVFGLLSIWLAISGALVLCSFIFQITETAKNGGSVARVLHLCSYLLPKFLQIFMYAWYGNVIADESEACLDSVYNSNWPDSFNVQYKNDILIVLTQEPLILTAMGCMYIQLDMFTKIIKTSVSYFCLLQTINEASAE